MLGYILLAMAVVTYLLQKIRFEGMGVEVYRSEDQCCYDVNLGRRSFTFDNGNIRSRRDCSKHKLIAHFKSVEDFENMDWKTKWKIYRNY